MASEVEGGPGEAMEPNMGQARRTALMAHGVVIKLKEMGLPEDLDGELGVLCTDLGDLWGAQKTLAEGLEGFLESPNDWEAVGDHLVDLRATIDHVGWHARSVRRSMNRITRFAYRKASETGNNS